MAIVQSIEEAQEARGSDYGSDVYFSGNEYDSFDDEEEILIEDLLTQLATTAPKDKTIVYRSIETLGDNDAALPTVLLHSSPPAAVVRVGKGVAAEESPSLRRAHSPSVEVEYNNRSRDAWSVPLDGGKSEEVQAEETQAHDDGQADTRSPLERFRTKPKKPLSVTDLVNPAWCELQYWYNLTKFGRVRRTKQMKQGSKIHRTLEEEVHEIVAVQVQSKEDRFGLNIWNTIQGLRTLKATGMTRELQIWGVINGQVVNGVIDEISYTSPDPVFEETLEKSKAEKAGGTLPLGQLTLAQTLALAEKDRDDWIGSQSERVVYVSDVKTRGSKSVPIGASLRPTWMQLMLYRRMLESLALNTVDAETIFERYNLSSLERFTDVFMREADGLGGGSPKGKQRSQEGNGCPSSVLQASKLQDHNNLMSLWSLMITEFQSAFNAVSDVLRAEFRWARTGEVIGSDVFAYSANVIETYVDEEMKWWKGERDVKGVEIEEAFKCKTCDFADICTWRKQKIEEATEKHRLRAAARTKSAV